MMEHRPFPEIVSQDKDWEVFEETQRPRTDMTNRKMYVPLGGACTHCGINHGRVIRRHELGHVKWSPKSLGKLGEGVLEEAVHLLEEIRINHLLCMHGIPMYDWHTCQELHEMRMRELIEKGSVADIMKFGLASIFLKQRYRYLGRATKSGHYYMEYMGKEWVSLIDTYEKFKNNGTLTWNRIEDIDFAIATAYRFWRNMVAISVRSDKCATEISFKRVKKYAKELSEILLLWGELPQSYDVFLDEQEQKELADERERRRKEFEEKHADDPDYKYEDSYQSSNDLEESYKETGGVGQVTDNDIKRLHSRNKNDIARQSVNRHDQESQWGKMHIHKPPCNINLSNRIRIGYTNVAQDRGQTIKDIHRWTTDKKVFGRKGKVYGGTVLIDASGSMRFTGKDILEIMQEVPAVTIAMYNGYSNEGHLRIIARNGRRVDESYINEHAGSGNVVDLPALQWLGKQDPRRIWVSDMQVVDNNGVTKQGLEECIQAMKRLNIFRLANVDEVKRYAKRLNKVR